MPHGVRNNTQFVNQQLGRYKDSKSAKETNEEKFIKHMNLVFSTLKHQDPLNPTSNAEMATLFANFEQTKTLSELSTTMKQLADSNKFNALQTATSLQSQNKPISYDNSIITFLGKITECPYEITPLGQNKGSEYTQVPVTIVVCDDKGKEVFRTKKTAKPGKNIFLWDGKNEKEVEQPNGDYKIIITSDDKDWETKLKGTANIEAVERDPSTEEVTLKLNDGKTISLKQVIGTSNIEKGHDIDDYTSYIGKIISTENTLQCVGGNASISYNNPLNNDVITLIEVFDKQGKVVAYGKHKPDSIGQHNAGVDLFKTSDQNDVLDGEEKLDRLESGKYVYKLYLKDLDSGEHCQIEKPTEKVISVSKSNNEPVLVTNMGNKYKKEDIIAITEDSSYQNSGNQNLGNDIIKYLGKDVEYVNSLEIDDSDDTVELSTPLLDFELPEGAEYKSTELQIDSLTNGAQVFKGELDDVKYTAVPKLEELYSVSRKKILDEFKNKDLGNDYVNILANRNNEILRNIRLNEAELKDYIRQEFRKGNIVQQGVVDNPQEEQIRKRNKAMVFNWDKKDSGGHKVPAGEYNYLFTINYATADGKEEYKQLLGKGKVEYVDQHTHGLILENGEYLNPLMVKHIS